MSSALRALNLGLPKPAAAGSISGSATTAAAAASAAATAAGDGKRAPLGVPSEDEELRCSLGNEALWVSMPCCLLACALCVLGEFVVRMARRSLRFLSARSRAWLLLHDRLHERGAVPRSLLRALVKDLKEDGRLGHLVLKVSTLAERPKSQFSGSALSSDVTTSISCLSTTQWICCTRLDGSSGELLERPLVPHLRRAANLVAQSATACFTILASSED
mmetsp:Transcript_53178/g.99710  ORF Transcript_53178/g.99710 Transcript_53178/m.99710 type:complete len:219 (+) Transcript_53178:239-895(+)